MFTILLCLCLTVMNLWWAKLCFKMSDMLAGWVSVGAGAFCFSMAIAQISSNVGFE